MINWNDYPNNNTAISLYLNTVSQSGVAATITTPAIGILVDSSTSFLTTGITFSANHASRTGIHLVTIPSGTITGSNVTCTAFYVSGTVDSISVVNRLAASFTVGRYGQAPANFTGLVVDSSGFIGANVKQYNGITAPSGDFTTTMKTSLGTAITSTLSMTSGAVNAYSVGDFTQSQKNSIGTAISGSLSMTSGAVNAYPIGDFSPTQKTSITTQASSALTTNLFIQSGVVRAVPTGDFTTTMKTSINTEVVDGLNVDTYAEPGQGTPGATLSLAGKIGYIYKAWRNRKDQTSGQYSLYNDDGVTVDHKATVTGSSTLVTVNEITTGP